MNSAPYASSSRIAALLAMLGAISFTRAQTVAPTSPDRLATLKDSTITLSPFEVREDSDNG